MPRCEILPPELRPPPLPWPAQDVSDTGVLSEALTAWVEHCPRPLVLFLDEIDSLEGQSLVSVLRQLRDGFTYRSDGFPHSVVLCGMRDVRDYRTAAGSGDPDRLGSASPFNVKVESLRVGDFSLDEVGELYGQHSTDTGQRFTDDAVERAFGHTRAQPWLVNALAREIVEKIRVPVSEAITVGPRTAPLRDAR